MEIKRASNFTSEETDCLIEIITKYKSIIQCKKTDTISVAQREDTWETIAEEFNKHNLNGFRKVKVLKTKYFNLKKDLKKRSLIFSAIGDEEFNSTSQKPQQFDSKYKYDYDAVSDESNDFQNQSKPASYINVDDIFELSTVNKTGNKRGNKRGNWQKIDEGNFQHKKLNIDTKERDEKIYWARRAATKTRWTEEEKKRAINFMEQEHKLRLKHMRAKHENEMEQAAEKHEWEIKILRKTYDNI